MPRQPFAPVPRWRKVAALVIGLPIWVSIALLLGESLAFAIEGWCVFMVIAVAVYGSVTIYAHRHG